MYIISKYLGNYSGVRRKSAVVEEEAGTFAVGEAGGVQAAGREQRAAVTETPTAVTEGSPAAEVGDSLAAGTLQEPLVHIELVVSACTVDSF
jgi:hypothetical protein